MFTHQAFLFRNERQELVTAMVSIPCQLSASAQPQTAFNYINSNIGTPPALIPAYSYIPLPMATRQPSAAVRTNENMIGDLFCLNSHRQPLEYPYQQVPNNGVHYAHPLPVTTLHNSLAKMAAVDNGISTAITSISSVPKLTVHSTSSLTTSHSNGPHSTLGPINVDSKSVTVLQSGRVDQDKNMLVKCEDDSIIKNGHRRRSSSARGRRISSSSEDEDCHIAGSVGSSEKSDPVTSSNSSPRYSEEDSPISNSQNTQLFYSDFGAYYNITCGDLNGQFYISRFARGSIGKCILYQGVWHTPNSFQSIAGHQCSKDWKKSIRCGQLSLKDMIKDGKFQEHPKSCTCGICFSVADIAAVRDMNNNSKVSTALFFCTVLTSLNL